MNILYSVLLAIFFFIAIVISYRLMGKAERSELSIFDMVINLMIADVVATGIVEERFWLDSLTGLVSLVALQILFSRLQSKFPKLRQKLNGEPSLIIMDGKIRFDELRKLRIQLDELILMLRQNNVHDIESIQYAILEINGHISIYTQAEPTSIFPMPFAISGTIRLFAIKSLGLCEEWFYRQLEANGLTLTEEIEYIFYDGESLILHTKTDIRKYMVT